MKILMSGGGTGGHVTPALSIADYIKARKPDAQISFVGTSKGLESDLVPRAGYKLHIIETAGLRRSLSLKNIKNAYKFFQALRQCKKILKQEKPDYVIGTGGYVSAPIVYQAARMGIKTAIHEQNAFPGLTSKFLARYVDKVFISFADSEKYFPKKKTVLVGNPVSDKMLFTEKKKSREILGIPEDLPYIVSFGGSLGSKPFNLNMADFISICSKEGKFKHTHATGAFGMKWMPDLIKEKGVLLENFPLTELTDYIYNMEIVMSAADLLITRAGALSMAEAAVMGKPTILIPSPNVTNNHQYYNALAFKNVGASELVLQQDSSGELLYEIANDILSDRERLEKMGVAAQKIAIYDSSAKIYDEIMK